jgi:Dolichyl-phosphate-mannose-protein mannosyltransferase
MTQRLQIARSALRLPGGYVPLRLVVSLTILVLSWLTWGGALRTIFEPKGELSVVAHENFNGGLITGAAEIEGFEPSQDGWALGSGKSGSLTYRFKALHEHSGLKVYFYKPPSGTNRLWLSADGGKRYQVLTENNSYHDAFLSLSNVHAGDEVLLKFEAFNPGPDVALVVDDLRIVSRTHGATILPNARTAFNIVLAFGLAIVVWCRRWPLALSTLLILAVAASLRYDQAKILLHMSLEGDASLYLQFSTHAWPFTEYGFFSGHFGIREPMFIFVAAMYGHIFGSSDFGLRLMTVILSTLSVWAVLRVGRGLFGDAAGQLMGLAMALNTPLVAESARGLRLELEIVLCMAYFFLAFVKRWTRVMPAAVALSVLGGLLVSTRSTYLPGLLALNALALYRPRKYRAWMAAMAVSVAIFAAFIVPVRIGMYRYYNDAFYDATLQSRWVANMEFAGRPGFPTAAELTENAYIGPPITYGHYLFGLHTPAEVALGTLNGFYKLFRRMELWPTALFGRPDIGGTVNAVFQALAAAGLVLALWNGKYRWIPVAFVLFELQTSFLYDRRLLEWYRHTYSGFPLVLFGVSVTLSTLWTTAFARRERLVGAPSGAL